MPSFDSWGPAQSGARLAEQDSIARFQAIAQGQHQQALAQEAQTRAAESQRLTKAMSQLQTPDGKGGPGAGGSMAAIFNDQAMQLSQMGFPVKAAELASKAADITHKEAQTLRQQALVDEDKFKEKSAVTDRIAQTLAGVTDQRSWDAANMVLAQQFPNQPNPLASIPYDPRVVKALQNQALKVKDRLSLQLKEREDANEQGLRKARESYLEYRKKYLDGVAKDRAQRTDLLIKNAGSRSPKQDKPINAPTLNEQRIVGELIQKTLPDPLPPEEIKNAQAQIAAEAKRIARETPGISFTEAAQRAVTQGMKDGDFRTVAKTLAGFQVPGSKTTRFAGGGKTVETALQPPADMKFQTGRFYQTPKGVMQFDGKVWKAPKQAAKPALSEVDLTDEEE